MSRAWRDQLHPELVTASRMLPNVTFGPWATRAFRLLFSLMPTPRPTGVSLRRVQLGAHDLWLFVPDGGPTTPAALLWTHGGGRIIGSPLQDARLCARLARTHGIIVAATGYRLAPEHPFPAALDDCTASWEWLAAHATELGIDPQRVVIGGESAGGGLAAELAQRLRGAGGTQPAGQLLAYPMLDDRTAAREDLDGLKHLVWNNTSNRYGWSSYLGQPAGSDNVGKHAAAARCVDLSGLPPAWVTIGTLDLFLEENRDYASRLQAAGVPVTVHEIAGACHGYFSVGRREPVIQEMWASLDAFLRARLGG